MAEFKDRLKEILQLKGIKAADLSKMTEIPKSSISRYLSGDYKANQRNVYLISKALNINPLYIMGISDDINMPNLKSLAAKESITKIEVLALINSLNEEQLNKVKKFINDFIINDS